MSDADCTGVTNTDELATVTVFPVRTHTRGPHDDACPFERLLGAPRKAASLISWKPRN
jgi:hypothetical protein